MTGMDAGAGIASVISFLGMWTGMMAAMMLPSVAPMLWRHHHAVVAMRSPSEALRRARRDVVTALQERGYVVHEEPDGTAPGHGAQSAT